MKGPNGWKRSKPPKGDEIYKQLWRVVDGAVADAFAMHPDYLTKKGQHGHTARLSIVKRVTGSVLSYAERSAEGRSGLSRRLQGGAPSGAGPSRVGLCNTGLQRRRTGAAGAVGLAAVKLRSAFLSLWRA